MNDNIMRKNKAAISIGKGTLAIILINIIMFIALNNVPNLRENLFLNHEISMTLENLGH